MNNPPLCFKVKNFHSGKASAMIGEMNITLRRRKDPKIIFVLGLLFTIFSTACTSLRAPLQHVESFHSYKPVRAEFDLGDAEKFRFNIKNAVSDGGERLLIYYEKIELESGENLGAFFRISRDGGASFDAEQTAASLTENKFGSLDFIFTENGIAAVGAHGRNIFYTRTENGFSNWTEPVQINDEQNSFQNNLSFLQTSSADIFCVWQDTRRGFPLVFFSASHDGGQSWSHNQPIEYDFREGNQTSPQIVSGANDRLLIFWEDWRDRRTLVDIRYSYSDDGGNYWTESRKLNDDEEHVWQVDFSAAANGENIFVAFSDFRESGAGGDNDWNIYFTSSADNGTSWQKNTRLNDVKEGKDNVPQLAVDRNGNLYCFWITRRETIFGQIAFSYSMTGGKTWSPSVAVTDKNFMPQPDFLHLISANEDRLLFSWVKTGYENSEKEYLVLEKTSSTEIFNKPPDESEQSTPVKFETTEKLFFDDFSDSADTKWETESGLWVPFDGTYMGVDPDGRKSFSAFARFQEPERYVLRGRFKLDAVSHFMANIYFRADESRRRHYVVGNQFRTGAWLSIKDNDLPNGLNCIGGKPLAEKHFPFQSNRWYEFTLVVTPEQIDYYVDGRLMFSHSEKLIFEAGKIGLGGYSNSPTYFDDIAVYDLKP